MFKTTKFAGNCPRMPPSGYGPAGK